jgi:hypothetical protein
MSPVAAALASPCRTFGGGAVDVVAAFVVAGAVVVPAAAVVGAGLFDPPQPAAGRQSKMRRPARAPLRPEGLIMQVTSPR